MSAAISVANSNPSFSINIPTPQAALEKRILEVIEELKLEVLNQPHNLRITCPITCKIMNDPAKIKCGHVFERSAIEQQDLCIICSSKVKDITTDAVTLGLIEELKKDFVPTLEHFKSSNPKTAQLCLAFAQSFMTLGNSAQALSFLKKTFTHTKSSALVYEHVPRLYDRLGKTNEALVARLHLTLYHVRDNKSREAINTLAPHITTNPRVKTLFIALSILGYPCPTTIQNARNYALSLKETNPIDSDFIQEQLSSLTEEGAH